MEAEDARDYKEPCPLCSEVNWGISDEGTFYCRSCHTVIERTREPEQAETFVLNARMQSLSRGLRKKNTVEKGWEWYICEGFQFILLKQAEALESLGVDPRIKDEVLCHFWWRYLQKTRQAYCNKAAIGHMYSDEVLCHFWWRYLQKTRQAYCNKAAIKDKKSQLSSQSSKASSDLDSGPDIFSSAFSTDTDENLHSIGLSLPSSGCNTSASDSQSDHPGRASSGSASNVCSGAVDISVYKNIKRSEKKMTMPITLAFCYLSLLWLRESITLSDLLRLVLNGHVPYINPEQYFPEETKISLPDSQIFRVQTFPVYRQIIELTHELGTFLDLPCFPSITETCFYHPNVLCMKYLMEVNLPDELHNWTYRVAKKTGLDDVTTLTYDPVKKRSRCIPYDIQAAAIIIVVLKLLFVLNDFTEWQISEIAKNRNEAEASIVAALKKELHDLTHRITEVDDRVTSVETATTALSARMEALEEDARLTNSCLLSMHLRLDDSENRNRRNNLRLRGIPEATTGIHLRDTVAAILNTLLGKPHDAALELDREEIIRQAWRQGPSDFDGATVRIMPDLSRHTLRMRRLVRPLLDLIRSASATYRWGHPFHLIVRRDDSTFQLHSPDQLPALFRFLNVDSVDVPNWLEFPDESSETAPLPPRTPRRARRSQPVFEFSKWYETMRTCMEETQQKQNEQRARFSWRSERVVEYDRKMKSKIAKKKQITKNLMKQFSRLAGTTPDAGNPGPSTFLFNWEEPKAGMISFHGHSLEGITRPGGGLRPCYMFSCLKKCTNRFCTHWKVYDKTKFPGSYDFVLSLFSLVLGVEIAIIHQEVCLVEEKLFEEFDNPKAKKRARKS
ncbi:PREDICTED: TATA box-binding protein-associated factor RNA polymerase I subunit B [Nanorana parkeri]|uniref:TATA box-binding protein-associated factor RNA polymerase I subunit B n=1 Tax=Nanorana parkeri TaxID=125878 RepID=UPI00085491A5|nr:PREDICTED: TATA box-binding protein-associated factor RNA polymerase I subunit B [Nanorana parkeri]